MKILTAMFLALWLTSSGALAFGESSILLKDRTYCAMNRPGDRFGKLTVGKDTLSWASGQKSRYKAIIETKECCIVELTSNPLPEFYGTAYKYIKFDSVEPDRGFELIGAGLSNTFNGSDIGECGEWFSYALLTSEEAEK